MTFDWRPFFAAEPEPFLPAVVIDFGDRGVIVQGTDLHPPARLAPLVGAAEVTIMFDGQFFHDGRTHDVFVVTQWPSRLITCSTYHRDGGRVVWDETWEQMQREEGGALVATLDVMDRLAVNERVEHTAEEIIGILEESGDWRVSWIT